MSQRLSIIGASGGIGRALCQRLQATGAQLLLLGRNGKALEALQEEYPESSIAVVDAVDRPALQQAVAAFAEDGGLDGMVNLAGSIFLRSAARTSDADLTTVLDANLRSAFNTVAVAQQLMRRGSVVLMSSVAARTGLANHEAIAAAKAGVEGLTVAAAASSARKGLRFNAVAPSLLDTPMAAPITDNAPMRSASERMHPLGRIGTADDAAAVIEFLLGPHSSWISGQILAVDGGLSALRGGG